MECWVPCQLPAEGSHFLGPFCTQALKGGPQGIEGSHLSLVALPCPLHHQGWGWNFYTIKCRENAVACAQG